MPSVICPSAHIQGEYLVKHAATLAARALGFTLAFAAMVQAQQSPQAGSVDIVGVRPGMSSDEVQAVLKTRSGPWKAFKAQLTFQNQVGTGIRPVPNGTFVDLIAQANKPPGGARDFLTVAMSPVPGHEEVSYVSHTVDLYGSPTMLREADFLRSIAEKYGEIPKGAAQNQKNVYPAIDTWGIGAKPGQAGFSCNPGIGHGFARTADVVNTGGTATGNISSFAYHLMEGMKRGCGDLIITVEWEVTDITAAPDQRFLLSYSVSYIDPKRVISGLQVAQKLSVDAQAADTRGAVQNAAGNKPTL